MDGYTAIGLDHHEAQRLRETRFEPSGIFNSAPRNEESHPTILADSPDLQAFPSCQWGVSL
jgi:hypothetical protein